ncbi:hypothetical protein UT300005_02410 [Clostridium sp. CTA-5]
MMTHVFGDSFTHETGYFVMKLNFLRDSIDLLGHKIYVYKIGQHGGTLLGFIIILIFLYKIRNERLNLNISIKNKIIYHSIAILCEIREVFNYMRAFEEKNNEVQIGFDI